jgi:hypothetical protein
VVVLLLPVNGKEASKRAERSGVASGKWQVVSGKWQVASGKIKVSFVIAYRIRYLF